MTLAALPTRLSAEDLLSLPDNGSMEFVNGQIVEKPVSALSSRTEARITTLFGRFIEDHHVAELFSQGMGYKCFQMLLEDPGRMRKPDVSVVRVERFLALGVKDPGYMPIFPDLAVEVLSPNDVISEMSEKVIEYRDAGFPLVWVVNPLLRTVTVHPNPGKPSLLSETDTIEAPNALPGFSCKVAEFFPPQ